MTVCKAVPKAVEEFRDKEQMEGISKPDGDKDGERKACSLRLRAAAEAGGKARDDPRVEISGTCDPVL